MYVMLEVRHCVDFFVLQLLIYYFFVKAEPPILRQLFILMLRGGHLIQKSFIFSIYRIRSLDPLDLEEVSRAQCKFKGVTVF